MLRETQVVSLFSRQKAWLDLRCTYAFMYVCYEKPRLEISENSTVKRKKMSPHVGKKNVAIDTFSVVCNTNFSFSSCDTSNHTRIACTLLVKRNSL